MKLTTGQEQGLDFLNRFVNSKTSSATLAGFAGTGKTTLLKAFLAGYGGRVAITAPTHKAVSVMSKMLNKAGKTLHSLHGLMPNMNLASFDINNIQFDPSNEPKIQEYQLIIIDEASMINLSLFKLNDERAKMFNVKVLYVGDELQLPPIGERVSAVFGLTNVFRLTEIVRQDDTNPIKGIVDIVRDDIRANLNFNGVIQMLNKQVDIVKVNNEVHGYAVLNKHQFNEKLLDEFPRVINPNINANIRYLTYTNEDAMDKNTYIRNSIIRHNDIIGIGDILTAHVTTTNEFLEVVITNSSDYKVLACERLESDYGFAVFLVDLIDMTSAQLLPSVRIVDHGNATSWKLYKEVVSNFYFTAISAGSKERRNKWREYYAFKRTYLQMLKITVAKGRTIDKDITYGYANTVHKSQGSTYDTSFINLKSLVQYNDNFIQNSRYNPFAIEYANKLVYVALTRASIKDILIF